MTRSRTLLTLLALTSLTACGPDAGQLGVSDSAMTPEFEAAPSEEFAGEATLMSPIAAGWSLALQIEEGDGVDIERRDLSVDVVAVEDGRCPYGVVCIQQGQITVEVDVLFGEHKATVKASEEQPAWVGDLKIEVMDSMPYPGFGRRGEAKRVTLLVTEYERLPYPGRAPEPAFAPSPGNPTAAKAPTNPAGPTVSPVDPRNPLTAVPLGAVSY